MTEKPPIVISRGTGIAPYCYDVYVALGRPLSAYIRRVEALLGPDTEQKARIIGIGAASSVAEAVGSSIHHAHPYLTSRTGQHEFTMYEDVFEHDGTPREVRTRLEQGLIWVFEGSVLGNASAIERIKSQ